jgi:hypothetical protein
VRCEVWAPRSATPLSAPAYSCASRASKARSEFVILRP